MKKRKETRHNNQDGFVLIAALLILLVLTLMGIAVNRNTTTEWRIAMNDREAKDTFYLSDAATELSAEVLVQNIACSGFDENVNGMELLGADKDYNIYIEKHALGFWRFYAPNGIGVPTDGMDTDGDGEGDGWDCDTDDDGIGNSVAVDYECSPAAGEALIPTHDIIFPYIPDGESINRTETSKLRPLTTVKIGGNTKIKEGAALQMAAGYEGLGKGLAGGGTELVYDINARVQGKSGSESFVCVKYAHILGTAGTCNY
ncbi:MAG: hypothetical protein D3924_05365 [Candidatus Electrothrix sp. AR4]|nr:hypothetical protein [Candidatus Electrothrix sp. AR4]